MFTIVAFEDLVEDLVVQKVSICLNDLLNGGGPSLHPVYILLRQSQLSSEDQKRIITESKG